MDNASIVFLPLFINRITEVLKEGLIERFKWSEKASSTAVLASSLVLGSLGVIFVFPATNLIPGQGASLLAEQIVTGVVIGGLANGIDFLGTQLTQRTDKANQQSASADISIDVQKAA